MPELNSALAMPHPYHQPCKIEGNSLRRRVYGDCGAAILKNTSPCPPATMIAFIEHLLRPGCAVRSADT
jgi:hypothetical protein